MTTTCPPLEVLVPQGRDDPADYRHGVPAPADGGHAPVNFHAMAAASKALFHKDCSTVPASSRDVLVLVPRRIARAVRASRELRARGHRVWIAWKECGAHQIAAQMEQWLAATRWKSLVETCHGLVAASPAAENFFRARPEARKKIVVLPTPYPVDVTAWDFSLPPASRAGIFIGTREWNVPSRRHPEAVTLAIRAAHAVGTHVSLMNIGARAGHAHLEKMRRSLGGSVELRIIDGPLPYADYLRVVSEHRLVLQRDASGVPGQVAGDSLLCGLPCLGGNGLVDGLAFPFLPGADDDDESVLAATLDLLRDDEKYSRAVARSQELAARHLSFAAFARQWAEAAARPT